MTKIKKWLKRGNNAVILVPVVLTIILLLGAGTYFGINLFQQQQEEQNRQTEESLRQDEEDLQREIMAREEAERQNLLAELRRDHFYDGLYLDDIHLSILDLDQAITLFMDLEQAARKDFIVRLAYEEEQLEIDGKMAGLYSNWAILLSELWLTGRDFTDDMLLEELRDHWQQVQDLQNHPVRLYSEYTYQPDWIQKLVLDFAKAHSYEPISARATGFDTRSRSFILQDKKPGLLLDGQAAFETLIRQIEEGRLDETVYLEGSRIDGGMDADQIRNRTGLISEARTYYSTVNPGRDNNIRLICEILNGMVLQPGEQFSFNGYIGRRTAERGFQEAGVIIGGILVDQLGGGICQPNTTLFQAAALAGLQIVERHPHSWPSSYTEVGLDATVSYSGPDFKFRNDTEYPVAIRAWYDKPAIVFQIYGPLFEEGVTVTLEVEHQGYTPIPDPEIKETFNPELKPGERLVLREPYIGQRTTAYRVWKKDGREFKRDVIANSYYRPLQGLVEYGPELEEEPAEEPEEEPGDENGQDQDDPTETDQPVLTPTPQATPPAEVEPPEQGNGSRRD